MRTAITLEEFLFTLNQDEDMRVTIIDYERDERIITEWKLGLRHSYKETNERYEPYKDWFVQDFVLSYGGVEITIVELQE